MANETTPGAPHISRNASASYLAMTLGQEISIEFMALGTRHKSNIVGFEKYKHFIARLPMERDFLQAVAPGAEMIVRYEKSGTLYGFQCAVIEHVLKDSNLLIFTYPTGIETIKLRRHARVVCMLPAVLTCGPYSLQGFMGDISKGGCKVLFHNNKTPQVRNTLKVGQAADIRLPIDGVKEFACNAVVREVNVAVQFTSACLEFQFASGIPKPYAEFVDGLIAAAPNLTEQADE